MPRILTTAFAMALAAVAAPIAENGSATGEPQRFLRTVAGFSDAEITNL
jgi:hypothetical protein